MVDVMMQRFSVRAAGSLGSTALQLSRRAAATQRRSGAPELLQRKSQVRTLCNSSEGPSGGASKPTPDKQQQQQRVRDRRDVEAAAAARRRHQEAVDHARWATSWMMPWERAHMDDAHAAGPLKLWERVYWRLFVVLGGVGFAYETWVLGNRRMWLDDYEVNVGQQQQLQPNTSSISTSSSSSRSSSNSNSIGDGSHVVGANDRYDNGIGTTSASRSWTDSHSATVGGSSFTAPSVMDAVRSRPERRFAVVRHDEGWYRGHDVESGRLLTDEDLVEMAKKGSTRWK